VVAIAVSAISAVAPPMSAAGRENECVDALRIGASPKPEALAGLMFDMFISSEVHRKTIDVAIQRGSPCHDGCNSLQDVNTGRLECAKR
jgi:hypothetical protein